MNLDALRPRLWWWLAIAVLPGCADTIAETDVTVAEARLEMDARIPTSSPVGYFARGTYVLLREGLLHHEGAHYFTEPQVFEKVPSYLDVTVDARRLGFDIDQPIRLRGSSFDGGNRLVWDFDETLSTPARLPDGVTVTRLWGRLVMFARSIEGDVELRCPDAGLCPYNVQLVSGPGSIAHASGRHPLGGWERTFSDLRFEALAGAPRPHLDSIAVERRSRRPLCVSGEERRLTARAAITTPAWAGGAWIDIDSDNPEVIGRHRRLIRAGMQNVSFPVTIPADFLGTARVSAASGGVTAAHEVRVVSGWACKLVGQFDLFQVLPELGLGKLGKVRRIVRALNGATLIATDQQLLLGGAQGWKSVSDVVGAPIQDALLGPSGHLLATSYNGPRNAYLMSPEGELQKLDGFESSGLTDTGTLLGAMVDAKGTRTPALLSKGKAYALPYKLPGSYAVAGSPAGTLFGLANAADGVHLLRWTRAEQYDDLGTLGKAASIAAANESGEVAGTLTGKRGERIAFAWSAEKGLVHVPLLKGYEHSRATAIDCAGIVYGVLETAVGEKGPQLAFAYSLQEGLVPLFDRVKVPKGLELKEPLSVGPSGEVFVRALEHGTETVIELSPVEEEGKL